MSKNTNFEELQKNVYEQIFRAATNYLTLDEVDVEPTPQNVALYKFAKEQIVKIRDSGQGVILPN